MWEEVQRQKSYGIFPDGSQGKHAITHWKVLQRLRYVTLIQCNLETGRTHQIRAHMKHIDIPYSMMPCMEVIKSERTQFAKYKTFVQNCLT